MRPLGVLGVLTLLAALAFAQSNSRKLTVTEVLAKKELWGKDFGQALVRIQSLSQIGQKQATIFNVDQVVGGTQYTTRGQADEAASKLKAMEKTVRPDVNKALQNLWNTPLAIRTISPASVQILSETGGDQVATKTTQPAQFLASGTTVSTVQRQLGPPEKVTQQVIQTEYERRPVVLTLYSYADGAITFAESNMKAKGEIDRVIVDSPKVAAALQEAKR